MNKNNMTKRLGVMKKFKKDVDKIVTWKDTPYKVNKEIADCINRALEFKRHGCCYTNTPIPFCSIRSSFSKDGTKTYSLEFSGISDWEYTKSVPLEKIEFNYIVDTIKTQLKFFMQEWADHLIKTEMLVEMEGYNGIL